MSHFNVCTVHFVNTAYSFCLSFNYFYAFRRLFSLNTQQFFVYTQINMLTQPAAEHRRRKS